MNLTINSSSIANSTDFSQNTANNNGIQVDGNKISWPDNGWYEVQSATSYNTMSEGGTSATMPHGTYNVINHTTGERFENITVGQDNQGGSQRSSLDTLSDLQSSTIPTLGELTGGTSQRSSLDNLRDSPTTTDMLSDSNVTSWGPGGIKDGYPPSAISTITPESTWWEVGGDAARDAAVAGYGSVRAGARHPLIIGEVMLAGAILSITNNVEVETVRNPDAVPNSSRYGSNEEVSSTESAVNANFGTAEQGEFGGLEGTYPSDPEPVSQPTTTAPARDPNRNSGSDTDNGPGGGGVSSSQSASDGGWGSSAGGEFG